MFAALLIVALVLMGCGQMKRDEESFSATLRASRTNTPVVAVVQPIDVTVRLELNHDEEDKVDFAVVTQASSDRAWLLGFFCDRWPGELAVALLATAEECEDAAATVARLAKTASCSSPRDLRAAGPEQLDITVPEQRTFKEENVSIIEAASLRRGRLKLRLFRQPAAEKKPKYPINALRNAAVVAATTSHILVLDIDFVPSTELYDALVQQRSFLETASRLAIVVPAFQRKGDNFYGHMKMGTWREKLLSKLQTRDDLAPATVPALAKCLARARCVVFDSTWNPLGHSTTDSARWLIESMRYATAVLQPAVETLTARRSPGVDPNPTIGDDRPQLRPITCFKSHRFEPYLVVRKSEVPVFNDSFTGYGKNKIEFVTHLRYLAFSFAVLPVGFVCHIPHPLSKDKEKWLHGKRGKRDSDKLYVDLLRDMQDSVRKLGHLESSDVANRTWLCDTPHAAKPVAVSSSSVDDMNLTSSTRRRR